MGARTGAGGCAVRIGTSPGSLAEPAMDWRVRIAKRWEETPTSFRVLLVVTVLLLPMLAGSGARDPRIYDPAPPRLTFPSASPSPTPTLRLSSRTFPDCDTVTAGYAAATYERPTTPVRWDGSRMMRKSFLRCQVAGSRYRGLPATGDTVLTVARPDSVEDLSGLAPEVWLRREADESANALLCDHPQPFTGGNFDYAVTCYVSFPAPANEVVATVSLVADGVMASAYVYVRHSGQPAATVREFTTALALTAAKSALATA